MKQNFQHLIFLSIQSNVHLRRRGHPDIGCLILKFIYLDLKHFMVWSSLILWHASSLWSSTASGTMRRWNSLLQPGTPSSFLSCLLASWFSPVPLLWFYTNVVYCSCSSIHLDQLFLAPINSSVQYTQGFLISAPIVLLGECAAGEELQKLNLWETDSCLTDRCYSLNSSRLSSTTNNSAPPPFTLRTLSKPPPSKQTHGRSLTLSSPPRPHPFFILHPRTQRHFILFKSISVPSSYKTFLRA